MDTIKKSSYDWLKQQKYDSVTILGYHGWDASRFKESMEELVDEKEFNKRLSFSRIEANPHFLMDLRYTKK